jgi:D-amino-acid dehydrogenase
LRVIVIGGGVIGLGIAYELARHGSEVTVLERGELGAAASSGNAGWISPALCSAPVPAPGVISQALRWMLRPDSPFLLRPQLDLEFARWLWAFRRACRRDRFQRAVRAFSAFNAGATDALLAWRALGVEFELHRDGLLIAARDPRPLEAERRLYEEVRAAGLEVHVDLLDRTEAQRLEPALSDAVTGGLHSPDEWHVRPESLTAGLRAALLGDGGQIQTGTEVVRLSPGPAGWHVSTSAGSFEAERLVVAAGAETPRLLRPLGAGLPITAAKGYSITAEGDGIRPSRALYLLEARVACSPFDGGVRLAGTLELAGMNLAVNPSRMRAIEKAAETYLRWRPSGSTIEWAGLRPLTPDGLPVIGELRRHPGLFVATGHGMAGVTLAAVTASALAPVVAGKAPAADLVPFLPDRFGL